MCSGVRLFCSFLVLSYLTVACGIEEGDEQKEPSANNDDENTDPDGEGSSYPSLSAEWYDYGIQDGSFAIGSEEFMVCESSNFVSQSHAAIVFSKDGTFKRSLDITSLMKSEVTGSQPNVDCAAAPDDSFFLIAKGDAAKPSYISRVSESKVSTDFGEGGVLEIAATGISQSFSSFDTFNDGYVFGDNKIYHFDSAGKMVASFGSSGVLGVEWPAASHKDTLYYASSYVVAVDNTGSGLSIDFESPAQTTSAQAIKASDAFVTTLSLSYAQNVYYITKWTRQGALVESFGESGSVVLDASVVANTYLSSSDEWRLLVKKSDQYSVVSIDAEGTISSSELDLDGIDTLGEAAFLNDGRLIVSGSKNGSFLLAFVD